VPEAAETGSDDSSAAPTVAAADANPDLDGLAPAVVSIPVQETSWSSPQIKFTYPYFVLCQARTAHAVENAIVKRLERERDAFDRERDEIPVCNKTDSDETCLYELECAPRYASERVVSVLCAGLRGLGGAHPEKKRFAINLGIRQGAVAPVALREIFAPQAPWARAVAARATEELERRLSGDTRDANLDGMDELVRGAIAKPDFALEVEGLRLVYANFPFALGPQDVLLQWSQVEHLSPRFVTSELTRPVGDAGAPRAACERDSPLTETTLRRCAKAIEARSSSLGQEGVGLVTIPEHLVETADALRRGEGAKVSRDATREIEMVLEDDAARRLEYVPTDCEYVLRKMTLLLRSVAR
jgi:hypothetical protein